VAVAVVLILGVTIYGYQTTEKAIPTETAAEGIHGNSGPIPTGVYADRPAEHSNPASGYVESGGPTVETGSDSLPEQNNEAESSPNSPGYPVRSAGDTGNVTVDPNGHYYTVEELKKGLYYDLVPLAPYFIKAQEDYGIDAVFLASVAALESGWGQCQFRKYNLFGFEGYDFRSYGHCIDFVAGYLQTEYLTPGGSYYEGLSVDAVNVHYNGRDTWAEQVKAIMGQITYRIERTDTECTE